MLKNGVHLVVCFLHIYQLSNGIYKCKFPCISLVKLTKGLNILTT